MTHLALADVEALCFGSSFLMADPMGPLLDQDDEEAISPSSFLVGKAPASPSSSNTSPLSPYQALFSAPPSPPATPPPSSSFLGIKVGADSMSWLDDHVGVEDDKEDAFADMEWMAEKIDLNDLDLESLICSCSSDESPSSPEEFLASLDPDVALSLDAIVGPPEGMELDLSSVPPLPTELPVSASGSVEEVKTEAALDPEVVIKSEPLSPAPSPPSPGIEADHSDAENSVSVPTSGPDSCVSCSLADQASPSSSDSDSDSGFESFGNSPSHQSPPPSPVSAVSRSKPYCKPEPGSPAARSPKVKSVSGAPRVVERKLKKMEQNKTAATRYRQKKRVEQELLNDEREELEKKNQELEEKAAAISKEIQYLRNLMEEARKRHLSKTSSVA
ncbi:cyclic AMP-dependent transcription factor ATF-4 [Neosynchiropus ocellatus]